MPVLDRYAFGGRKVIDVDTHLVEPFDLWTSRAPASLRFWFERRNLAHDIKQLGVDNCMFETDYPHPICLYPVDNMDDALAGLTEPEIDKVLHGNAAKLYNIAI